MGSLIKDIKYIIKVVLEDITSGEFVEFSKTIRKNNIEITSIPSVIDKRDVRLYVEEDINKYCQDKGLKHSDLVVDGYEIEHDNLSLDIYFTVEDMNIFSLEPSVMIIKNSNKVTPILEAEQIDERTIRWTWNWGDNEEYTSVLTDFVTGLVISHTPIGVNYFIESGLNQNEVVTRVLTVKKGDVEVSSIPISMNVFEDTRPAEFRRYKNPKRNDDYKLNDLIVATRLKAFQSGVGDNEDCKIFKPNETKYAKRFKLMNKIYGVRASSQVRYNTVKFFYRYMLKGKVNYKGYDGSFKVKARAISVPVEDNSIELTYGEWIDSRKNAEYHFNDEAFVSEIFMYDIFEGLPDAYFEKMKFEITLYDINGRMEVYSQTHGKNQIVDVENESITFELTGYHDTVFRVKALPKLKEKDYIEVYPPISFDPLVGAVNGDFEMSVNGKKDTVSYAPEFDIPSIVYDRKFYCLIDYDKVNPYEADVQFKFENQVQGEDYSLMNGDKVIFSCDTIIEDETEYREFITQIDKGDYAINDNRKHTYRYKLDLSNLNRDKYKRFEIDVESDVNDIVILESYEDFTLTDDTTTAQMFVSVRSLQSAIARWNPYIHSGYYYYNQEERFLFNKSNINGENVKTEQFCYEDNISVNVIFDVKGGDGKYEEYKFELKTEMDLDKSPNRFDYVDGMLWPRPLTIIDGFPNYAQEYIYDTKPFVCPKEPTNIISIDWEEIKSEFTDVEAYIVSYNDIYGEWRDPIRVMKGGPIPKTAVPAKIMKLRFVLKPSLKPKIVKREDIYSCEADWNEWIDKNLSYNVYYKKEALEQRSKRTEGYLISNLHDLGDTIDEVKERSISYSTSLGIGIKVYYQQSDSYESMSSRYNAHEWIEMDFGKTYMTDRYVRFKIVITEGARVKFIKNIVHRYEYSDMSKEDYLPAVGDIKVKQEYNPSDFIKRIEYVSAMTLPFDAQTHTLVDNVKLLASNLGKDQNFKPEDVVDINFMPIGMYSDEYNVIYDRFGSNELIVDKPINVQSKEFKENLILKENNQSGTIVYPKEGKLIEVTPIPQQFTPIIIHEEDEKDKLITPLTQVYFLDKNGEYTLNNVEEFESLGFKTLYLKNYNIDTSTTIVRIDGILYDDYEIKDNILIFKKEVPRGSIVSVTYRIKNSFIANYDYANDKVIINLHGDDLLDSIKKVRIHYETHKTSALRKLEHISLNPIYNAMYSGYIYISDKMTKPFKLTIVPSDNMIYANGKDTMNVLVKVDDKEGNPIPNINVNLASGLGTLDKKSATTDINGIAKYTYTSWTGDCVDKLKAKVAENVYSEATIINRKVIKSATKKVNIKEEK